MNHHPINTDVLVTAKLLKARLGGISDMTIWRWLHDPKLGFPAPVVINKRRFWYLGDIVDFEARHRSNTSGKAA